MGASAALPPSLNEIEVFGTEEMSHPTNDPLIKDDKELSFIWVSLIDSDSVKKQETRLLTQSCLISEPQRIFIYISWLIHLFINVIIGFY